MTEDSQLLQILESLRASRASAKERQSQVQRNIRQEARKLREQTGLICNPVYLGVRFVCIRSPRHFFGIAGKYQGKGTDAGAAAAGRRLLELDNLVFQQGSHLMSNRRCELPTGSYRTTKKGYEEVCRPILPFPRRQRTNFTFTPTTSGCAGSRSCNEAKINGGRGKNCQGEGHAGVDPTGIFRNG